jgi:hypothetical protein
MENTRRRERTPTTALAVRGVHRILQEPGEGEAEEARLIPLDAVTAKLLRRLRKLARQTPHMLKVKSASTITFVGGFDPS